jgi:hypothetical protein
MAGIKSSYQYAQNESSKNTLFSSGAQVMKSPFEMKACMKIKSTCRSTQNAYLLKSKFSLSRLPGILGSSVPVSQIILAHAKHVTGTLCPFG